MNTTKYGIGLLMLCLLSTLAAYAQNSPQPGIHAASPETCPDGLLRACNAAVDELQAARKLIASQDAELKAAAVALDAQRERVSLLAEQNGILQKQIAELNAAIEAQKAAGSAMTELLEKYRLRVVDLEADLAKTKRRVRKMALGAFVGGLVLGAGAGR